TISNLASPQITNEDTNTEISFLAGDVDGALTCSSANFSYTSSNTNLVAASGAVVWGGSWPNCKGTITPVPQAFGYSVMTFKISDGAVLTSRSFTLSVIGVNDAPTLSAIENQQTNQNTPLNINVAFNDIDSTLTCSALSGTSNNTSLLANASIQPTGTYPNCTINLAPAAAAFGVTSVTLTVTDGSLTATASFSLTVRNTDGWYQEAYIKAANADAYDEFGWNLDLNGDTLAVGSMYEDSSARAITNGTSAAQDNSAEDSGAVYIYRRNGNNWSPEAYIKASNADKWDNFSGTSLSGDTLAVSATQEDSNQNTISNGTNASGDNSLDNSGAVYVYKRTGSTWSEEAYIKSSNIDSSEQFGKDISIDGDTLSVSANFEDSNQTTITNGSSASSDNSAKDSGAVYIFKRIGKIWSQSAYIKASNSEGGVNAWTFGDLFGSDVSLSGDTLAASARYEDSNQTNITNGATASSDNSKEDSGAVYIFRNSGLFWSQEAYIKPSNSNSNQYFGVVSLSGDTLAVGAERECSNQTTITNGPTASFDTTATDSGAAYVFRRIGSTWSQEAYIKAANAEADDGFGSDLSLLGTTLAVAAYNEKSNQNFITNGTTASSNNTASYIGAVYIYQRNSSSGWAQEAYIKSANAEADDYFGFDVSLSGDTLAASAIDEDSATTSIINGTGVSNDNNKTNSGAVFIYRSFKRMFDPSVSVSARTGNSITFRWSSNLGSATAVKVAIPVTGTDLATAQCTGGTLLPAGTTTYTVSSLSTSTKYGFRFCAWDGSTASEGTALWAETTGSFPVISDIPSQSTTEDTPLSINVTLNDTDSTMTCSSSLRVSSSNPALQPLNGIAISGIAPNCTITFTPSANRYGTASITVGAYDEQSVVEKTFILTFTPLYDLPWIANVTDLSNRLHPFTNVPLEILADSNESCSSALSATSSNESLIPSTGITFGGTYPYCTFSLNPIEKKTGTTSITLIVNDGTNTTQDSFNVSIQSHWQQEAYIKAANADSWDLFGELISLNHETLAVGVDDEDSSQNTITNGTEASSDNGADYSGAVYVYHRTGNMWQQQAYIKAGNSDSDDGFSAASLSRDSLAVGALGEASNQNTITNGSGTNTDNSLYKSGAVYVYRRSGSTWSQEAFIKASNAGGGDGFGFSTSLDDNTLAVGAPYEDSNQSSITNGSFASIDNSIWNSGAVYVFARNWDEQNSLWTWTQQAYIKAANNDQTLEYYGMTVELKGETLAVNGHYEDSSATTITNGPTASADNSSPMSGAVYVYRRNGSQWAQEAYIKASNTDAYDAFGSVLAISGDSLAVGVQDEASNQTTITNGPNASSDNSATSSGATYIFRRTGTNWAQEAYIKAANAEANDYFGFGLDISGNFLAVGAYCEDSNETTISYGTYASINNDAGCSGAVYLYQRSATTWAQEAYVKSVNLESPDYFGYSVSISGDTFAVGAPEESSSQNTITNGGTASTDNSMNYSGAVYVYRNTLRLFEPDVGIASQSENSITFAWGENLGSATSVIVAPATSGTAAPSANCSGGTVLPAGTISYTYPGLTAASKYGFRFCAWDGTNISEGMLLWAETKAP
ncbi:MAG: putative signal peptide protein, partial [Pseudomonadota bacterium]